MELQTREQGLGLLRLPSGSDDQEVPGGDARLRSPTTHVSPDTLKQTHSPSIPTSTAITSNLTLSGSSQV